MQAENSLYSYTSRKRMSIRGRKRTQCGRVISPRGAELGSLHFEAATAVLSGAMELRASEPQIEGAASS